MFLTIFIAFVYYFIIISDNILECFENVSDYFQYVEMAERGEI